jgi:hypothetical protein
MVMISLGIPSFAVYGNSWRFWVVRGTNLEQCCPKWGERENDFKQMLHNIEM